MAAEPIDPMTAAPAVTTDVGVGEVVLVAVPLVTFFVVLMGWTVVVADSVVVVWSEVEDSVDVEVSDTVVSLVTVVSAEELLLLVSTLAQNCLVAESTVAGGLLAGDARQLEVPVRREDLPVATSMPHLSTTQPVAAAVRASMLLHTQG